MDDRIHQVLDGELRSPALTGSEVTDLDDAEAAIARTLARLRHEPAPDVTSRVMRRLDRLPAYQSERTRGPLRHFWTDAWRPRRVTFVVRPAWGLACAALGLLLLGGPLRGLLSPATRAPIEPAAAAPSIAAETPVVLVQFRLDAPDAREVQLAGDFTGWEPRHALHPSPGGVWTVTVPVVPGVHEYAFIVNGERWVADPLAPSVADGFGGANSRLDVLAPARGL